MYHLFACLTFTRYADRLYTQTNQEFNQELINAISTRIKETPFLIEAKPPEYEFINNKVLLFINAKNKPANFINGIIGIQPQSDGSINITGDANLKFINAIKKGETFSLNWKKMYALSQSLNTKIELPFLSLKLYLTNGDTLNSDFEYVKSLSADAANKLYSSK